MANPARTYGLATTARIPGAAQTALLGVDRAGAFLVDAVVGGMSASRGTPVPNYLSLRSLSTSLRSRASSSASRLVRDSTRLTS